MSKQTKKSRYPSRYSPWQFVTAAQYIIELVCEKRAKKRKKDLPIKFWDLPEWQKFFVSQLRRCHLLLKKYEPAAIINALQCKEAWGIDSLFSVWLVGIIEQEQDKLNNIKKLAPADPNIERKEVKKIKQHKNKAIDSLMDLDNDN